MKFIDDLLLIYKEFYKNRNAVAKEAEIRTEEKLKKYYLNNYGAYRNADELTVEEILEVFWKILVNDGYDVSNFNGSTSIREPAKQCSDWDELGNGGFLTIIDRIFDFSECDITDQEYSQAKTFGELANLVIRKAREKKQ